MRGFAKFLAFLLLLIIIGGGVAWLWAGRQPGPAVQFRQPDKFVGQASELELLVQVPEGRLSRLDVAVEQGGKSFPVFSLDQPTQATTRQDAADRLYVMRPIGKRARPASSSTRRGRCCAATARSRPRRRATCRCGSSRRRRRSSRPSIT